MYIRFSTLISNRSILVLGLCLVYELQEIDKYKTIFVIIILLINPTLILQSQIKYDSINRFQYKHLACMWTHCCCQISWKFCLQCLVLSNSTQQSNHSFSAKQNQTNHDTGPTRLTYLPKISYHDRSGGRDSYIIPVSSNRGRQSSPIQQQNRDSVTWKRPCPHLYLQQQIYHNVWIYVKT